MQLTCSKLTTDYEVRLISVGLTFGEDIPVRKWSITTFGELPVTTSRDSSPILSHVTSITSHPVCVLFTGSLA